MSGFFQDGEGNNSSTRLIGFIVIMYSLILSSVVLLLGYLDESKVMVSATAAGLLFTTIAGPVMFFMFNSKKEETKVEEAKK